MSEGADVKISCPSCGTKYRWKPELAGRKIHCAKCDAVVRLPAAAGGKMELVRKAEKAATPAVKAAPKPAPPPPPPVPKPPITDDLETFDESDSGGSGYELAELNEPVQTAAPPVAKQPEVKPVSQPPAKSASKPKAKPSGKSADATPKGNSCPSCGQSLKPAAVICLNCGFNVASGAKIKTNINGDDAEGGGKAKGLGARFTQLMHRHKQAVERKSKEETRSLARAKLIDIYLPIGLIIVGLAFAIGQAYYAASHVSPEDLKFLGPPPNPLITALKEVGIQLVLLVPLLFVAMLIAVKLLSMAFGPVHLALPKLFAIALGPGALGAMAALLIGGGLDGALIGIFVSAICYLGLLMVLFSLDLGEAIFLVIILSVLQKFALTFLLVMINSMFFRR